MKEIARMLVVLTLICTVCGLGLAALKMTTAEDIEMQKLKFEKAPALRKVLAGADNLDAIIQKENRTTVTADGTEYTVFIGKKGGEPWAIAYETSGTGYGGALGIMVGYTLEDGTIAGAAVTSMSETPGIGARVKDEDYGSRFAGMNSSDSFALNGDGGTIDAITGATISSGAYVSAVSTSAKLFDTIKTKAVKEE